MAHYMDNDTNSILLNFRESIKDERYNKLSVEDWVNLISKEMSLNYITTPYNLDPKILFRARLNIDKEGNKIDFFNTTSELWAPSDEDVKRQGRCNTKGQSLLYCSSNLLTELGYRLNKSYWGKGFATEAAKASLQYGFNTLNLNKIYAIADSKNVGSRNVIEKVGLKYIETFTYSDIEHDWFEIQKS